MSLNTGPLRAMPARSSREMLHSRGGRSSVQESATGCCKSNPYIRLANEARSKQMFVRLIFSHLAWQQFVAGVCCEGLGCRVPRGTNGYVRP